MGSDRVNAEVRAAGLVLGTAKETFQNKWHAKTKTAASGTAPAFAAALTIPFSRITI